MKRWFFQVSVAAVLVGSLLGLSPGQAAAATSLKADYQFQNDLTSCVTPAPALQNLGPGTNSFSSATVDGTTRTVLAFPLANGVVLGNTTGVVPNDRYSIVMLSSLDIVSGYRRLIDFKNGTSDNGAYVLNAHANFYPVATGGTYPANTYVQFVLTRDSSGQVNAYIDGALAYSFADTANNALIDANNVLRFFRDNETGANTEHSPGQVARIRLYDDALTAAEVGTLDRLGPCAGADTTAPVCRVTGLFAGPPKQQQVTVTDTGSGLKSIDNISITNGTVAVDPFTVGTTTSVHVTATKLDQTKRTTWSFDATDVAGNKRLCV